MLSAALITYNEEGRIVECLRSIRFCDEIVVVDSGSSDRTKEIASEFGAKVAERVFDNFSDQKNAAIDRTRGDWILLLDADERVTPELREEIQAAIREPAAADAYFMKRVNVLFGRRMRHGANADDWQLRLVRRGCGRFEGLVHERLMPSGRIGRLHHELMHFSYQTLRQYFTKFPLFSTLDAKRSLEAGYIQKKRDFWLRPIRNFVFFYFFKGGLLDGFEGFLYHALGAYYEFVRQAKLWEMSNRARINP